MKQLSVKTERKWQIVDISSQVAASLPLQGSGVVVVFVQHSGCAMTVANLDPGTDLDLLDFLEGIIPDKKWRHPHNPEHAPDHLIASLIGPSVSIPYENGKLLLGIWQHIVLVELDGPRERQIICST